MTEKELVQITIWIMDALKEGSRSVEVEGKFFPEDFQDIQFAMMRAGKLITKLHIERMPNETRRLVFSRPGDKD